MWYNVVVLYGILTLAGLGSILSDAYQTVRTALGGEEDMTVGLKPTATPERPARKPLKPISAEDLVGDHENPNRTGFDNKTGRWMAYPVNVGTGEMDVGRGLKLDKKGFVEIGPGQRKNVLNSGLTPEEETRAFRYHLSRAVKEADKYKRLNQNQKAALVDMFYQTGPNYFARTKAKNAFGS